ncbi:MAG TPA: GyrI-like domain-containing protein, partial [Burkholderiaceae bacterium]|nr:GyrI-like domain-containing protein [Burkholderiaceae bacterium]
LGAGRLAAQPRLSVLQVALSVGFGSGEAFARAFGISHDDPSITEAALCRYDACVEVDDHYRPSGTALVTTLPGGRYAEMPFEGTSADIATAWARLLRDWLPGSRMQLDGRPCFEHYPGDAGYDAASGVFGCRICIPVAPL